MSKGVHIYDLKPSKDTETYAKLVEAGEKWKEPVGDSEPYPRRLYHNSHQIVLHRDGTIYRPHDSCVGGVDYGSGFIGGVFAPSIRRAEFKNNDKNMKMYEAFLDWQLSCGPASSAFFESSIEEVKANDWNMHFHGDIHRNVLGMAIISVRMWIGFVSIKMLHDWWTLVSEHGVHPWPALYLVHVSKMMGGGRIQESYRGLDSHHTFSQNTNFPAYKRGIVQQFRMQKFTSLAKISYCGTHNVWYHRDNYDGDEDYDEKWGLQELGLKPCKSEDEEKPKTNNLFLIMQGLSGDDVPDIQYPLSEENVAKINEGIDDRIIEATKPWFEKWNIGGNKRVTQAA